MTARRIIPCLDVKDGRVVKGVRFVGHTDMGAKRESVNPMKALAQMARAGTNNTQGSTDGAPAENTGAQAGPAQGAQGAAPAESAARREIGTRGYPPESGGLPRPPSAPTIDNQRRASKPS